MIGLPASFVLADANTPSAYAPEAFFQSTNWFLQSRSVRATPHCASPLMNAAMESLFRESESIQAQSAFGYLRPVEFGRTLGIISTGYTSTGSGTLLGLQYDAVRSSKKVARAAIYCAAGRLRSVPCRTILPASPETHQRQPRPRRVIELSKTGKSTSLMRRILQKRPPKIATLLKNFKWANFFVAKEFLLAMRLLEA